MNCLKCGWKQDGGNECRRCGIVFSRYGSPKSKTAAAVLAGPGSRTPFRRIYRVFRWAALGSSILVLMLMLRKSPPPDVQINPEAAKRAEDKLHELRSASKEDRPYTLQLDEAELNSWLRSNLHLGLKGDETPAEPALNEEDTAQAVERLRSTVRDVKIQLLGDRLRGYVLFDFHGKDLTLVLEGRLAVEDGYLRLQPTRGTLGALPLPHSSLKSAVARLFDRPENRETFRVPPEIRDIRVERGELVVVRR